LGRVLSKASSHDFNLQAKRARNRSIDFIFSTQSGRHKSKCGWTDGDINETESKGVANGRIERDCRKNSLTVRRHTEVNWSGITYEYYGNLIAPPLCLR